MPEVLEFIGAGLHVSNTVYILANRSEHAQPSEFNFSVNFKQIELQLWLSVGAALFAHPLL